MPDESTPQNPTPEPETTSPGPQPSSGETTPPPPPQTPPPGGPPPMAKEWYLMREGQQQGPYTLAQVINWLKAGQLQTSDLCWKDGMANWIPLGSAPEFAGVASGSSAGGQAGAQLHAGVATAKQATRGAFGALKLFALNPVGGVPKAYDAVGKAGALSSGIVYFVVYELVWVLLLVALASQIGGAGIGMVVKTIVVLAVPFLSACAALAGLRVISGSQETIHLDVFIAGIISFVFGVLGLVLLVLVMLQWITPLLAVFIVTYSYIVMILFSAISKIYGLAESKAAWAVPAVLIVTWVLTYWVYALMIKSAFSRGMGGNPFGGGMPRGMF